MCSLTPTGVAFSIDRVFFEGSAELIASDVISALYAGQATAIGSRLTPHDLAFAEMDLRYSPALREQMQTQIRRSLNDV